MTAKIMHLVSSSFYGTPRRIHDPAHAASLLGLAAIKPLVQTAKVFAPYVAPPDLDFSVVEKNAHSAAVGSLAQRIALDATGDKTLAPAALLAGLVHDVGQLIFATSLPQAYQQTLQLRREAGISLGEAETRLLGASHADAGAYLLGLWGVADAIVDAVAHHHQPQKSATAGFTPLAAVHIADALICRALPSGETATDAQFDDEYVRGLGVEDKLPVWREWAEQVLVS